MPNLASIDWLIALIYFFFVVSIAIGLRQYLAKSSDFLLAGRALPAWLCGFALVGASLGSLEVLGMGAAGARYGFASAAFFGLGSIVPLLFAALFLMPVYYGSRARSLPGYLGLRFGAKVQTLQAILFLAVTILYAALSLYAMARILGALGVFEILFHAQTVGSQGVFLLTIALFALIALVIVVFGGLGAAMYAQVMQVFLLAAAFLPLVLLGLKRVGGWNGMKSSFAAAHVASGLPAHGGWACAAAAGLGILLTAGFWCTDFSLLQTAMAAENLAAARRAPLIAAAIKVVLPFLLVVPGLLALGLPTPHTTTVVHIENGSIYHEINVVPRAAEQGRGLVPARTDSIAASAEGNILRGAHGRPLLDYAMATPNLIPYSLPTGLLGLGITALLACLAGGLAARISACATVFSCDLLRPQTEEKATNPVAGQPGEATVKRPLAAARWAAVGASVISAGLACAALRVSHIPGLLDLVALSFAVFYAPMLMTFLLGVFWRRATTAGALSGLIAGFAAALAHYGLTLPVGEARGIAGGWIALMHHPASLLAQNAGTALCGWIANLAVTVVVSFFTAPRSTQELDGLTLLVSGADQSSRHAAIFAGVVLLAAIAVSIVFLF